MLVSHLLSSFLAAHCIAQSPPAAAIKVLVPDGFRVELFAREPLVADPVAFDIDSRGRIFVAESHRQERGVEDNRSSPFWLLDDLAAQTVSDRLAYYEKWKEKRKNGMAYYSEFVDRVRMVEDTDGDGVGDKVTAFSPDFRDALDGTGAGVLVDGDSVLYTCIPHLWRMRDGNGDGISEKPESMFDGFGVRTALRGHDMHGLIIGMDGLLYWSIGDRGYHVTTREGEVLADAKSGAVFRCRPDGTGLEVFATGLRNPQELAFNEFGDLFTGDNNSDGGDKARFVFVMHSGETGWDMNYQTLDGTNQRGPWNQEGIWHLRPSDERDRPAWVLPPLAHVGSGPSGLAYAPGTMLPPEWDGRFYLCDFLGSDKHSNVLAIQALRSGAGYEVTEVKPFAREVLATDVAFGPDGRVYVSDWGGGWYSKDAGEIYAVWSAPERDAAVSVQTRALLAEGFAQRPIDELVALLAHPDMRVRRGSHFALASMGGASTLQLLAVAQGGEPTDDDGALRRLAQIHAIWALGMQARGVRCEVVTTIDPLAPLLSLLECEDAEIRAQVARTLGEANYQPAAAQLTQHIFDEDLRVRAACAIGVGQLKVPDAVAAIVAALFENNEKDAFLRHALVMGLARCADAAKLAELSADPSSSVRLGVLLAMRTQRDVAIARFLFDPDFRIATEAARAIWDLPIAPAFPALAEAAGRIAMLATSDEASVSLVTFTRELWKNHELDSSQALETTTIFDQPPDETSHVSETAGFSAHGNKYLQRLRGEIHPPVDGEYQFFLTSDDHSTLTITPSGSPTSTVVIARIDGYSDPEGWESQASQISAPISLRAGTTYTLEARHAQGGGGNHLAIGWKLPGGQLERPIGRRPVDINVAAFARRTIAANLALGISGGSAIARIAANSTLPTVIRLEAIAALSAYLAPGVRDRVHGHVNHATIAPRDSESFRRAMALALPSLARDSESSVRATAMQLATSAGIALDQRANLECVVDETRASEERTAALAQLAAANDGAFDKALEAALTSNSAELRIAAREHLSRRDPARALEKAVEALRTGSEREQQAAIRLCALLAKSSEAAVATTAGVALSALRVQYSNGSLSPALALDLVEATDATTIPSAGSSTNTLAPLLLAGGDAPIGRDLVMYHSGATCLRCHIISGVGGHAGPALDGVGTRLTTRALLESLVEPGATIAAGFGAVTAMPPMSPLLTKREMRDVIAYLASLH